ncbi:MAG: hypothetical protein AAF467_05790 [Actinomycetota bacterium]
MSDKTLGKARGLNTIADPKAFKGSAGRSKLTKPKEEAAPARTPARKKASEPAAPKARTAPADAPAPERVPDPFPTDAPVDADVVPADVAPVEAAAAAAPAPAERVPTVDNGSAPASNGTTPHRAVVPGVQRKRRELSIPHSVAEALEATGINAADVVMTGYRRHGDAIYAGAGGRLAARGRTRLRLSISDSEFDQITRLGHARGWNRSETVSVILAMELIPASAGLPGA